MVKKHSLRFWIIFWTTSCILLFAWFVFLQVKNHSISFLNRFVDIAPISRQSQDDLHALIDMADSVLQTNDQEKTFLILFQNNMEIRPGGGFIGSFGILKVKDGHVTEFASHDVTNFDGRIPSIVPPPYPMKETLNIDSFKFRDSNYSPDFGENAKQAEYFYHLGDGQEQFDGVVAITTNVLSSFLKMTGSVSVPGYPGEYTADNAVLGLEEQVEKNFVEQGVNRGDRKAIMNPLAYEILTRVKDFSISQKYELFKVILEDLRRKDIQLSFKDDALQQRVERAHWDGKVDASWRDDYLMTVDANLGSWKSDYYVKRSMDYTVDFSSGKPHAKIAITYNHTATEKSWLTKDYQTYLRVYVPKGSWLTNFSGNAAAPQFGDEFGKKYFGMLVYVKLGESKTVTFEYDLPQDLARPLVGVSSDLYDLKIQKQPGLNDIPVAIHMIQKNGMREDRNIILNQDFLW
jgi:hypothetical protein